MNPIIEVNNLSKKYKYGESQKYFTLRDTLTGLTKSPLAILHRKKNKSTGLRKNEFWALKNISFKVNPGETLGIIGSNGAGKSTLLKILSRITPPTRGEAVLHGRVGSLLEVGTGFHQELTGRENVYLSGAVLGMKRREINKKFDEIVDFSGVEKFLDTPVKRYSSGMYTRLAFAVAAHLDPEILIVDEVLAVGDAEFQKKCLGKMGQVAKSGRTVLFVSHNLGVVSELCSRAILLDQGRVVKNGGVGEVIGSYKKLGNKSASINFDKPQSEQFHLFRASVRNIDSAPKQNFDIKEPILFLFKYKVMETLKGFRLIVLLRSMHVDILQTFDTDELKIVPDKTHGSYQAEWTIPGKFLKAGEYSVDISAGVPGNTFFTSNNVLQFSVGELSTNARLRGYSKSLTGAIISPGVWVTKKIR